MISMYFEVTNTTKYKTGLIGRNRDTGLDCSSSFLFANGCVSLTSA